MANKKRLNESELSKGLQPLADKMSAVQTLEKLIGTTQLHTMATPP